MFRRLALVDAHRLAAERDQHMIVAAIDEASPSWLDASVAERLGRDTVAIRMSSAEGREVLDVWVPMVVAFRNGAEIDRIREPETSETMLAWLDLVLACTTSLEFRRARVAAEAENLDARMGLAVELTAAGLIDEASTHYAKLYLDSRARAGDAPLPGWIAMSLRLFLSDHPEGRARFIELRDHAAKTVATLDHSASWVQTFREWSSLNSLLFEEELTIAWFDSVYVKLSDKTALAEVVDRALVRPLMERGRFGDAGRLLIDPLARIREIVFRPAADLPPVALDENTIARMTEVGRQGRMMVGKMFVRALVAAERHEQLRAVADYLLEVDESPEMMQMIVANGATVPS